VREAVGQCTVGEVAIPKIGKLCVVELSFKRTIQRPGIDSFPDAVGTGEVRRDLRLEKTPEKSEVEYGAVIRIWQVQKAGCARFEPLFASTRFQLTLVCFLVRLIAWWLGITLTHAFVLDLVFIVYTPFYTFAYNWAFDRFFGVPSSAVNLGGFRYRVSRDNLFANPKIV
jgi:hypothetical protein